MVGSSAAMVGEKIFKKVLKLTILRQKAQLSENDPKAHFIYFSEFWHMNFISKLVAGFKFALNIPCYE